MSAANPNVGGVTAVEVDPAPAAPAAEDVQPSAEPVVATPEVAPDARPEWLPDEFSSPEQMAEAYKHMKAGGDTPPPSPEPTQDAAPAEGDAQASDEPDAIGVQSIVESAGLDFVELSSHWQENRSLTDEHYAAFQEKMGLSKAVIDDFLLGQEARLSQHTDAILSAVGGEAVYADAVAWAEQNLPEAEQAAYNEAVESGNFERAKAAAQGLVLKFQASEGSEPNYAEGDGPAVPPANGFRSKAEITTAMADPRYATDDAYRADVEKRMAATPDSVF